MRERRILYISYPLLPVSDASCGGAEQMLWVLEREMASRGYSTTVAACDGSRVAGELLATGVGTTEQDGFKARAAEHCRAILDSVRERPFDLIHDKSGFFWRHASELRVPVLVTLHLPRSFYESSLFENPAANIRFNCVSGSQASDFADIPGMMGVVENGIATERFHLESKEDYVLWLGRICPEKAPHLAMDAAERAGVRLILAGQVYPFSWHQLYFDQEIEPRLRRLGDAVTWIERPTFAEKADLLAHARALLLPTLAPETSSLVAMEAMASGTPVIAFPNGAVPEIVRDGVTGVLVRDVKEMADAVRTMGRFAPQQLRLEAEQKFSARAMADGYEALYEGMLAAPMDAAA